MTKAERRAKVNALFERALRCTDEQFTKTVREAAEAGRDWCRSKGEMLREVRVTQRRYQDACRIVDAKEVQSNGET